LQLPLILEAIHGIRAGTLVLYGALVSALVILLRLLWIYPGTTFAYYIRRHWLHQRYGRPSNRQIFVVGWTGMRGVIALAAALSLPETLRDGAPFPQRNLIIFLTFCVILMTLVLQGLSLPWVIRGLGLANAAGPNCEEREARRIIARAALERLEAARGVDRPEFASIYDDLHQHYRHHLAAIDRDSEGIDSRDAEYYLHSQDLKLELLRAERDAAIALRSEGRINDEVLRTLEREFDLRETQLSVPQG
jgi:CPA1 family monovalent cation:H+ antiporter